MQSPDPAWDGHVPLVRSWILRKQPKKPIVWVEPSLDRDTQTISYKIREGGVPPPGTVQRAVGTCLATRTTIPNAYIKQEGKDGGIGQTLIAVVVEGNRGRQYLAPENIRNVEVPKPDWEPKGKLEGKAADQMPLYGFTHWSHLFTHRQLTALTTFSDLVQEVQASITRDAITAGLEPENRPLRFGGTGAQAYAEAVATYLAFAVDKLADLNNTSVLWEPLAQCPRHLFARQAIPMVWDFAEANPMGSRSGSWMVTVRGITKTFKSLGWPPTHPVSTARITQRDAVARIREVPSPMICTDPPYYDNISYADLSDFFYIWLRRGIGKVWPDETATLLTPKAEELIANPYRTGSKQAAKAHFEQGIREVSRQISRFHHTGYPALVFYGYKQRETKAEKTTSTGWETFLQGLVDTDLRIMATWPIRTETRTRMVAMGTASLASSVVVTCRPRPADAPMATRGELLAALRSELPPALRLLRQQAIAPVDMAQSMIGPGMAVFSRYSRVLEADGTSMPVRTALALINQILEETLSEEETEFDYETRWALTWYQQNGAEAGLYGDAETLSKAKNTSVSGVVQAGIAKSEAGKVQLIPRTDLDPDWDPKKDTRLTVWEVTQHLLARLERSEAEAADLLQQVGPGMGDRARQLAYLLYQTADRQKWTQEAVAYNILVTVWPTIAELAARPASGQASLLGG